MIATGLINIFYWFVSLMIGLLPSVTSLPADFQTAIAFVRSIMSGMIDLVPALSVVPLVISFILLFEVGMFAFFALNWVLNLLRGSGN